MFVHSSHIITLPSGNLARDFRWDFLSACLNEGFALDKGSESILILKNTGTITGVYMVDTKGLAYWLKELAAY